MNMSIFVDCVSKEIKADIIRQKLQTTQNKACQFTFCVDISSVNKSKAEEIGMLAIHSRDKFLSSQKLNIF